MQTRRSKLRHSHLENNLNGLFGYALNLTRNQADAEDLVQSTAEKALRSRNAPTDPVECRRWLFTVLRNRFIDVYRQSRHIEGVLDADQIVDSDQLDDDSQNVRILKNAIRELNLEYREIVGLVDIVGLSYLEAAQVLGIPVGTVMSRLSRARKTLQQIVDGKTVTIISIAGGKEFG